MGPQRVLQAIALVASIAAADRTSAGPARPASEARAPHERIAVIDLGSGLDAAGAPEARRRAFADVPAQLSAAIVAAGFEPVTGDGIEHALAGRDVPRDTAALAAAMASAQRAFGELSCGEVRAAAHQAIGIAAARQAGGLAAAELARAWTYVLLCADREDRLDDALHAAAQLRALGGSPDVPASLWAKYPDVDVVAGRELVELDITTDAPGAAIWIDFRNVGVAPLHVVLPAGPHVVAAAIGTKRGAAAGSAVASQKSVHVPLTETAGRWTDVAHRVASWNGQLPPAAELAWVLSRVSARVALVRRGDTVSAWLQQGPAEPPHQLGGTDGVVAVADAQRLLALLQSSAEPPEREWKDRAPDPNRPLLVEEPGERGDRSRAASADRPTKWWVYAAIAGAAAIGGTIIYLNDSASDRQRVELHHP